MESHHHRRRIIIIRRKLYIGGFGLVAVLVLIYSLLNVWQFQDMAVLVISENSNKSEMDYPSSSSKIIIYSSNSTIPHNTTTTTNKTTTSTPNQTLSTYYYSSNFTQYLNQISIPALSSSTSSSQPPLPLLKKTTKLLFTCGWPLPNLAKYLFPEFNDSTTKEYYRSVMSTTTNDIMLFGMHGPCNGTRKRHRVNPDELQHTFNGNVLIVNGEPFGNIFESNHHHDNISNNSNFNVSQLYQMGSLPDYSLTLSSNNNNTQKQLVQYYNQHSIRVFYVAVILVEFFPYQKWRHIFNPRAKVITPIKFLRRAVIYTARNCVPHRQEAAIKIGEFINIHFGGSCIVNTTTTTQSKFVPEHLQFKTWKHREHYWDNYKLYGKYKYCLVLENSNTTGYISEKILLAYMGGCIPIYWGTNEIYEIFNAKSFIFYDIDNPQLAIQQLKYLQQNSSAYIAMQNEPILKNGKETIENYFSLSDRIGNGTLKQIIRTRLGLL